jgi:hypothetical protein
VVERAPRGSRAAGVEGESGELRVETWRRGLVDCAAGESISADCCLESCRERECVCVCVLCVCLCLHVSVCSSVARTEHRGQRREDEDKERERDNRCKKINQGRKETGWN